MPTVIGVPRETFPGERRVAMVPRAMDPLQKLGAELLIESGAGEAAGFPDGGYADRGARIAASRAELFAAADVIVQVRTLGMNSEAGRADLDLFRAGQVVIGFADPLSAPAECRELAARGVTAFAMELMPRITRAQSMDALSSMATISGYKAVLLAADALPRMFPMMMTAAGTIAPARVFVIGAGVAGLQAIATARRLGAVVSAYDVRPAVKEQVESVGARFVEMPLDSSASEDRGGYAKEMDESFYRRQRELMTEVLKEHDVVIATAAVPGKKAPILITGEMVAGMAPGSVIVDIAAERGGNCELTRPGETVTAGPATILGPLNLPGTIPFHASQMYARNVATFLAHLLRGGQLAVDGDDEITRETLVTQGGEVVHPRIRQALGLPAAAPDASAAPATAPAAAPAASHHSGGPTRAS
ncbi:MAG TPA: Re/Si-specific NAD(P)(+) transhydrogenase subunit alpha [Thermoanaerobaculia bacterium]|nr:Re/Si-specific NAD(P)(+) transhydrogenase subunit alpha [Thermoanaerobaculia bacterium]